MTDYTIKNLSTKDLASRLQASGEWLPEEAEELCSRAGLADEWAQADGESFEAVAYKAADILGVSI